MQLKQTDRATSIIVCGAAGRMGARICALCADDRAMVLAGAIERADCAQLGALAAPARPGAAPVKISVYDPSMRADVVIDFSTPQSAQGALEIARTAGAALLVGTTGIPEKTLVLLRESARTIPVLLAANTSLGVAVLADAAARVARLLGPDFEVSIVEAHHSKKKDAPSGTALRLARAVRDGGVPVRDDQIVALRAGDVIGEHTIRFAGPGEYIELTHRATSRDLFALGALRAAKWLSGRAPGWYTIEDVLGLAQARG